ncbi:MAG: GAF domain-containing sensor histidine kinase [bacterium]
MEQNKIEEKEALLHLIYRLYLKYDHIEDLVKEIKEGTKKPLGIETCLLEFSEGGFNPIIKCPLAESDPHYSHCFERENLKGGFENAKKGNCCLILEEEKEGEPIYRLIASLCDSNKRPIAILNLTSKEKEPLSSIIKDDLHKHIELSYRINQETMRRWGSLIEISNRLTSQVSDISSLKEGIPESVACALDTEVCSLFLVSKDPDYLELVEEFGHTEDKKGLRLKIIAGERTGLTGYIAATRKPLSLDYEGVRRHPCWSKPNLPATHLPSNECLSFLAAPIISTKDELLGVIKVENKKCPKEEARFSREDEAYIEVLASHIAICLEMAEYFKDREEIAKKQRISYYASSHALKTPLHGLMLGIGELKNTYLNKIFPELKHYLADPMVREATKRWDEAFELVEEDSYKLRRVINNILYAVRMDAQTYLISPQFYESADISKMMNRIEIMFNLRCRKERIEIEVKISERDNIYMDKEQIEDVLISLVANAVTAIVDRRPSEKGIIKICVESREKKTYFIVSDNGKGIKEDLFSPSPLHPERMGLGLYVAKKIVNAHKGDILSKPLERGACIEFWLPNKKE